MAFVSGLLFSPRLEITAEFISCHGVGDMERERRVLMEGDREEISGAGDGQMVPRPGKAGKPPSPDRGSL